MKPNCKVLKKCQERKNPAMEGLTSDGLHCGLTVRSTFSVFFMVLTALPSAGQKYPETRFIFVRRQGQNKVLPAGYVEKSGGEIITIFNSKLNPLRLGYNSAILEPSLIFH
jgi:hypothetical protein